MALAMDIPELRQPIEGAVEIAPPRWIDDDALIELEERYEPLVFERFADGTLLVTPPAGYYSGGRNAELTRIISARASPKATIPISPALPISASGVPAVAPRATPATSEIR